MAFCDAGSGQGAPALAERCVTFLLRSLRPPFAYVPVQAKLREAAQLQQQAENAAVQQARLEQEARAELERANRMMMADANDKEAQALRLKAQVRDHWRKPG